MGSAEAFEEHRSLLFAIAYEITGTATDAEDVVQDSYLKWAEIADDDVHNPRAYLAKVATRTALNSLRSARRRREDYVGPWLPEPILTGPDVAEDAVLGEALSVAMLVVLESLTPDERAVFVLREVFDFPYTDIADATGKSAAAVRQLAHRAKEHVRERQPRFDVDTARQRQVADRFMAATLGGDLQSLMDLLAPGAVLLSDGGGKVSAARRPVQGADRVARFLAGLASKSLPDMRVEFSTLNSLPGLLLFSGSRLDLAAMVEVRDGQVTGVYIVRNPDKLARLAEGAAIRP
jgi:RNA polymerase sigma-70 factor, ECF subfamily